MVNKVTVPDAAVIAAKDAIIDEKNKQIDEEIVEKWGWQERARSAEAALKGQQHDK